MDKHSLAIVPECVIIAALVIVTPLAIILPVVPAAAT